MFQGNWLELFGTGCLPYLNIGSAICLSTAKLISGLDNVTDNKIKSPQANQCLQRCGTAIYILATHISQSGASRIRAAQQPRQTAYDNAGSAAPLCHMPFRAL